MEKMKQILRLSVIILSLVMCLDDSFMSFIEMTHSGRHSHELTEISNHSHISFTDHFVEKNSTSESHPEMDFSKNKPMCKLLIGTMFISKIWQPPKISLPAYL